MPDTNQHSELLADIRAGMKPDMRSSGDCPDRAGVCYCKQNRAHAALDNLVEQLEAHQAFLVHVSDWRLDKAIELVRSDLPIEGVMRERLLGRLLNIRDHADSFPATSPVGAGVEPKSQSLEGSDAELARGESRQTRSERTEVSAPAISPQKAAGPGIPTPPEAPRPDEVSTSSPASEPEDA